MLQFVDSFYCVYNQNSQNVVMRLRQEVPYENPEDEKSVIAKIEDVASIVMSKECAMQLASSILQICSADKAENNS